MKKHFYIVTVLVLVSALVACKSLQNDGGTDWATVAFSLESSKRTSSISASGNSSQTVLIMAVPQSDSSVDLTNYLNNPYDFQLQNLIGDAVKLRVPLNTSIRLVKIVLDGVFSLDDIAENQPTALYYGISDPFSLTAAESSRTVVIRSSSPVVSSISPDDGETDVTAGSTVSVTFSKEMDATSITTNSSHLNCTETFQVSADDFSTCILMTGSPVASSDNKTFVVTPAWGMTGLTVHKARVTTAAMDVNGKALANIFTTATGFTTQLGALSGTWPFVDGNEADGINKDAGQDASSPQLVELNARLYTTWQESNGATNQIRVAEWDGVSTWRFIDGDGVNGINKDTGKHASNPRIAVFNSKLYVAWNEQTGTIYQIRVAEWDSDSTWNFVDGNGPYGINKVATKNAYYPHLVVFNDKLYAAWYEFGTSKNQIRVAEWDGNSTWNFVDGDGATGINKNTGQNAYQPELTVFDGKLYATWPEVNTYYQVRVAEWDGSATWNFVDGNGPFGINKNTSQTANAPSLTVFDSGLYAIWYESNGSKNQIRIVRWDGSSTWNFVDGGGINGINKDPGKSASYGRLAVFNSRLLAIWTENNGTSDQVRVAEWDGSSVWSFKDGDGTSGINKDADKAALYPRPVVFDSRLFVSWREAGDTANQIRVAVAEME